MESSIRKCSRAGLAIENDRVTERIAFSCAQRLVQQLVRPERGWRVVTIVKGKAYLGGKSVMNTGGNIVDFLLKNRITMNAALVEIKTPATPLLGRQYRAGVFNPSEDLSGAIMQTLNYKHSLELEYLSITRGQPDLFESFDPACVVIVGNANAQLETSDRRKSFELLRGQHSGVRVITFDELFGKTEQLIEVLESSGSSPSIDEDEIPF